jgi:glycine/D-amino acid oxidase-like deaminating enzyme
MEPSKPRPSDDQVQTDTRGWWFREAIDHDPGEPAPPLDEDQASDVVIVGGGYTGMWTAYFLKESEPGIQISLLEREECGAGPSGRNGGFLSGWWDELPELVRRFGDEGALAACRAVGRSVSDIGVWCQRHGVDAWFTHKGYLQVASSPSQEGSWSDSVAAARRLGVGEEFQPLSPAEVRERCESPALGGGVLMRDGATVHPARLARGLRRVLLERGVRIYERTRVDRLEHRAPGSHGSGRSGVVAVTDTGTVRAEQAVMGINAWATRWPGLRRSIVTWGSHIVLTAPAPEKLAELGWDGECISDYRTALHYFRTTPDGRVAFGGGGGRASWLGGVGPGVDLDPASIGRAARGLRRIFPSLHDVPLEVAWGGPIDVSPTHLPFFGTLRPGNVHFAMGYTGNGVAPSHLAGQIMAALVLGRKDGVAALPLVGYRPQGFPPEPLRSLGAHIVRHAIIRRDAALDTGARVRPIVDFVARMPRKLGYNLGPE